MTGLQGNHSPGIRCYPCHCVEHSRPRTRELRRICRAAAPRFWRLDQRRAPVAASRCLSWDGCRARDKGVVSARRSGWRQLSGRDDSGLVPCAWCSRGKLGHDVSRTRNRLRAAGGFCHRSARGRTRPRKDLDQVISAHPELLGIGIDQGAAIVVHGNVFTVMGGQVAIHDGKNHDGASYYFLSSGQTFDLKARSIAGSSELTAATAPLSAPSQNGRYPLTLKVTSASRQSRNGAITTNGTGILTSNDDSGKPLQRITFVCDTGVFSRPGSNTYPARENKPYQIKIESREMGNEKTHESTCKF